MGGNVRVRHPVMHTPHAHPCMHTQLTCRSADKAWEKTHKHENIQTWNGFLRGA